MKAKQTECSETLAFKLQTLGNNPEESIRNSKHGERLKSRRKSKAFEIKRRIVVLACGKQVLWRLIYF
jgi:hypothetical protein